MKWRDFFIFAGYEIDQTALFHFVQNDFLKKNYLDNVNDLSTKR